MRSPLSAYLISNHNHMQLTKEHYTLNDLKVLLKEENISGWSSMYKLRQFIEQHVQEYDIIVWQEGKATRYLVPRSGVQKFITDIQQGRI